jgi:hypothetical protein
MKVTRFNYPLEKSLVRKIDLMIKRCTQENPKRDAVLLIEGAEGEGKTSLSIATGYYVGDQTGRVFNHTRVFFDINKMIQFLQDTDGEIAVWDEPALQALSTDALSAIVKDLKRMLMMCRKKRHFIIINVTYFNEFGNYIVWQRPLGMIHVYSRNEIEPGRFVYIMKRNLEYLYNDWRTKRKRNYFKYCSKSTRGTFPDVLNPRYKNNVLSDFDLKYYDAEKDAAIGSIGKKEVKKVSEIDIKRFVLTNAIIKAKDPGLKVSNDQLCKLFNISENTIVRIRKNNKEKAILNTQNEENEDVLQEISEIATPKSPDILE